MSAPSTSTVVRVPFTELQSLLQAIFQRHGCSEAVARVLAHNCARVQRDETADCDIHKRCLVPDLRPRDGGPMPSAISTYTSTRL